MNPGAIGPALRPNHWCGVPLIQVVAKLVPEVDIIYEDFTPMASLVVHHTNVDQFTFKFRQVVALVSLEGVCLLVTCYVASHTVIFKQVQVETRFEVGTTRVEQVNRIYSRGHVKHIGHCVRCAKVIADGKVLRATQFDQAGVVASVLHGWKFAHPSMTAALETLGASARNAFKVFRECQLS